jgi:Domain of unknown function (DUF4424)
MKIVLRAALLCSALALVVAPAALADDSSATLGAGGIVLTRNADIRMATEDLYLSPDAVKVHYTFINDSGHDIDSVVAFPLPDIDNYEYSESPIGTTKDTTPNFVGFALKIDGKTVNATAEERAIYKGKDVTAQVLAAGAPLNVVVDGGYDKLQKLSKAHHDALLKADLIDGAGGDDVVHAKWTTQTKFFWTMHFPAGKAVTVDHTYQPVTGQTFFSGIVFTDKQETASYAKYCIDSATKASILAGLASLKSVANGDGMFNQFTTDFVIVTANNWKGPIGKFHLTIDKLKPDNILSMCWGGTLQKTGPTRFESTLTDFAPKKDIELLVLAKPEPLQQ